MRGKKNIISHSQKKLAGILVSTGLTLSDAAEITGVSVRSVKRWYRANKSDSSRKIRSLDRLFILFDLFNGIDFAKTSARLGIPARKIIAYLGSLTPNDIKIQKCTKCEILFPAEERQRICPFCLAARNT